MLAILSETIRSRFTLPTGQIKNLISSLPKFWRKSVEPTPVQPGEQQATAKDTTPDQNSAANKEPLTGAEIDRRTKWKLRLKNIISSFPKFWRKSVEPTPVHADEQHAATKDESPDQSNAVSKEPLTDAEKDRRTKWKHLFTRLFTPPKLPNRQFLLASSTTIALLLWFPHVLTLTEQKAPDPQSVKIEQLLRERGLLVQENARIKQEADKYQQQFAIALSAPPSASIPAEKTLEEPALPRNQISVIFPKSVEAPSEDCSITGKADIREVLKRCIDAYNNSLK
jgi:hypothetical protein